MDVKYFDYDLPQELIAQTPLEKRSNSKLMVLDRKTGEIEHKYFYDIIDYLNENDVLVLNIEVGSANIIIKQGERLKVETNNKYISLKEKVLKVLSNLIDNENSKYSNNLSVWIFMLPSASKIIS